MSENTFWILLVSFIVLFICLILKPNTWPSDFFLIYRYVFFPLPVNELTDGSSWHTLSTTVCIYVLLKFMQGGGAGRTNSFMFWMHNVESELYHRKTNTLQAILQSRSRWRQRWGPSVTFTVIFSSSHQAPQGSWVTCAPSCGSGCSSTPTAWFKCACSPTCTPSPCAGTWAAKPATCWEASTAAPPPLTACSGKIEG